jgi:glycosyltransferase involved in cell wall biosynthesis
MRDKAMPKYVIVSPIRDEERFIEQTLHSVIRQTILPAEWIIVDDGSTDKTPKLLAEYEARYSWLRVLHRMNRGKRVPGTGVMQAFYEGYHRLMTTDWEFLMKLDGDVGLEPDYFQRCFERFCENPHLGICGGAMYCIRDGRLRREPHPSFHVRGPIKLYRRACWEAIGGLITAPGWDTVDEVEAQRLGWQTLTFRDLTVIHFRPTGSEQGPWRDGVKMGRAAYVSRYHPIFMTVKCVRRVFQKPYFYCGVAHAYGYITGYLKDLPRVENRDFRRYIRTQQLRRLLFLGSIWR